MGGSFVGTGFQDCDGDAILKKLNDTFGDPASKAYGDAKLNNIFDEVDNKEGNYATLLAAYVIAGVEVDRGWARYLRQLGKGTAGAKDIYDIAQTRYKALIGDVPMKTFKHPDSDAAHGGRHVKKHDGHKVTPADESTIDSPFPLLW